MITDFATASLLSGSAQNPDSVLTHIEFFVSNAQSPYYPYNSFCVSTRKPKLNSNEKSVKFVLGDRLKSEAGAAL